MKDRRKPGDLEPRQGSAGAEFSVPLAQGGKPARLVSLFGSLSESREVVVRYVFDVGDPDYQIIECRVDGPLVSITPRLPAAAWYERELHDQYGVTLSGHPDLRPLLFHENWPEEIHPLLETPAEIPWAKRRYPFLKVQGEGVCEVAVGPVHAGIIEPGHFRFSVMGDVVLHLELRHFYTHKGTEKLFEGSPADSSVMLAESVSGDNCFAHAVAYCQAVENACAVAVPPRAAAIRLVGLELERLISHIGDAGFLANDVGFVVAHALAGGIKESLLQASASCFGTRYLRGVACPGGVRTDLDAKQVAMLRDSVTQAAREFAALAHIILETPSVQSRFETAGVLYQNFAEELAVVGPVARACGVDLDVRRDHPYGHYRDLQFEVPTIHYGDVLARARIRIQEAAVSSRLICEALGSLPPGPTRLSVQFEGQRQGLSAVESPRGELLYWVGIENGRLVRCHIKSPSFQNWPAMPFAVAGNIIADFPLINKSFNLSYSGCDR
ncbi:MAG: NADH-quinone oxidoreductase subunit C [Acidobacteria bacterium]|nr:NADH-quinone oxidoreductase subunit C [Acidobacteriota bacterium]MCL5287929.1 NADH-quinone oxidoreductase subunit C [Acidobacteriota bacterium]